MRAVRTLVVLLLCLAPAGADELRTLSGKTLKGTLVGVTDQEVKMQTEAGVVATPLAEILALDLRAIAGVPAGTKYTEVRLLDGTLLRCSQIALKPKEAEVTLLSGQAVKVPLNFLVTYLHDAHDPANRKPWEEYLATKKVNRDRLLVAKNDTLNALEGTVLSIDPKGEFVEVKRDNGQVLEVPLEKLQGIIFLPNQKAPGDVVCHVMDIQGNSVAAAKMTLDGTKLTVTTPTGVKFTYEQESIARFDYNLGKLTYLSAMAGKIVRKSNFQVFDSFSEDVKKDVNLDGQPIMINGTAYAKGLTLGAHTEAEYNLDSKYKKFQALLAVIPPPETDQVGIFQARVVIECDGGKKFTDIITTKGTVPLNINVENVNTLRIIVTAPNGLDLHAYVTLADAKVTQ